LKKELESSEDSDCSEEEKTEETKEE